MRERQGRTVRDSLCMGAQEVGPSGWCGDLRRIHPLGLGGSCASAWTSAALHPQTNTQDTREALDPQHSTTSCAAYVHYALCNRTMCLIHSFIQVTHSARTARTRTVCHEFLCTRFRSRPPSYLWLTRVRVSGTFWPQRPAAVPPSTTVTVATRTTRWTRSSSVPRTRRLRVIEHVLLVYLPVFLSSFLFLFVVSCRYCALRYFSFGLSWFWRLEPKWLMFVFRTEVNSDFRPMEFWERSGGRVHGRLLACLYCVTNSSKFRFISRQSRASHGDDRPPLRGGDSHLSFSWYCWQGGWQISLGNLSSVYMLVGDADTFLRPQFYSTVTIESSVGKRNVRGVYGSCCCTSTRSHS